MFGGIVKEEMGDGRASNGRSVSLEEILPHVRYAASQGHAMTEEQLEVLRRQISVYTTICHQLVEMHRASLLAKPPWSSSGHMHFDAAQGNPALKVTARQRWAPSNNQLLILERLFLKGDGTPNKQRIKEITAELSKHGSIQETNVYNWFQNRKARAKRKTSQGQCTNWEPGPERDAFCTDFKKPRRDSSNLVSSGAPVTSVAPGM